MVRGHGPVTERITQGTRDWLKKNKTPRKLENSLPILSLKSPETLVSLASGDGNCKEGTKVQKLFSAILDMHSITGSCHY